MHTLRGAACTSVPPLSPYRIGRATRVPGLVGAGDIGQLLDSAINALKWRAVAAVRVTIFAIVLLAEIVVTALRKRIIRGRQGVGVGARMRSSIREEGVAR